MPRPPRFHLARYRVDGRRFIGWIDDDRLVRLTAPPWEGGVETGEHDRLDEARFEAPVRPGKIVCVGLNYRAHIAESLSVSPGAAPPSEPLLFLKPPSAVLDPEAAIRYPSGVTRLDPEAELAVVIGRRARRVSRQDALAHVAGLTAFNDVARAICRSRTDSGHEPRASIRSRRSAHGSRWAFPQGGWMWSVA